MFFQAVGVRAACLEHQIIGLLVVFMLSNLFFRIASRSSPAHGVPVNENFRMCTGMTCIRHAQAQLLMRQDAFGGVMDFKLDGAGFGDTVVRSVQTSHRPRHAAAERARICAEASACSACTSGGGTV